VQQQKTTPEADIKALRQLAEQGHAGAQSNLGDMYFKGRGVPQDYAQAVSWTRQRRIVSGRGRAVAARDWQE
jgi:TPR repeat protein